MSAETMTATATIEAPPAAVFDVLADPSTHAAIDGTGWVSGSPDPVPIDHAGQVFRMAMYHENHPDKHYEMANQVEVFERPWAIGWRPGQEDPDTGQLSFGGWTWRYDLAPAGSQVTEVTLTYDWSAARAEVRKIIQFPPFGQHHLDQSLAHLASLATTTPDAARPVPRT